MDFREYQYNFYKTNDELMHYGVPGMHWGIRKKYVPHPVVRSAKPTSSYEQDKAKLNKVRKAIKTAGHVTRLATLATPIVGAMLAYKAHGIPINQLINKNSIKLFGAQLGANYIKNAPKMLGKMAVQTAAQAAVLKGMDYALKRKHGMIPKKKQKKKK